MKRVWAFIVILACVTGCRGYSGSVPAGAPGMLNGSSANVAGSTSSIVVHPSQVGATVSGLVMGANMATWYDVTQSNLTQAFKKAGMTATRWPGGSESDNFHWKTNSLGQGDCSGGYVNPNSTFGTFEKDIIR